jgi:serine/threonine-protein kinase HipA
VFSLLASNYDDHLRNHGFLMRTPGKWSLSPAYDLNPVPEIERAQMPKTAISEDNAEFSIEAALDAAPRFGLKPAAAKSIVREVFSAVADWRNAGKKLRIPARTLAAYASAFENPLIDETRKLG